MKKILIIEDDTVLQQIYKTKLVNKGYNAIQATGGDQGFNLSKSESPDLIILDIMLPGGPDGLVVLDKLKQDKQTKGIPVIVATNIDDQGVTAIEKGVVWYFVKAQTPIDEVVERIGQILG